MQRRWLVNLLLAALAAGLAAIAILRPGQEAPEETPPLTAIDKAAVKEIRIERPGRPAIKLERMDGGWRLVQPFAARADGYRVDGLLAVAAAESLRRLPADEDKLARYGLDKPAATLWLDDQALRFGGRHPIAYRRYVLYDGRIHLISASHYRRLEGKPEDWVDTRVLGDARPVAFAFPDFRLVLKEDGWHREPADPALGADALTTFVDEWRHARALRVTRHQGKPRGRTLTVTVDRDGGKAGIRLRIAARRPELVLHREDEGLDYHFAAEQADRLLAIPRPEAGGQEGDRDGKQDKKDQEKGGETPPPAG